MRVSGPLIVLVATLLISVVSSDPLLAPLLQSRTSIMPAESESNSSVMMADAPRDPAYENSALDWCECMICQKSTSEVLRCPCNDPRNPGVTGAYQAFAARFQELRRQAGSEPKKQHFKLHNLFDNSTLPDIAAVMLSKEGKWHSRCFVLFNSTEVNRGLERKRLLPGGTLPGDSVALTNQKPIEPVGPTDATLTEGRRKFLRGGSVHHDRDKCIFCQKNSSERLVTVATPECGARFYEMADTLQQQPLLTILTYAEQGKKGVEEDMKYHETCRTLMFNKCKTFTRKLPSNTSDQRAESLAAQAFCNLTNYIESKVEEGECYHTFPKLAQMHNGYRATLGIDSGISENLLKDKLKVYFEEQATWVKLDGKTLSLCFHDGLRNDAVTVDDEYKIMLKAGKLLRKAMFNHTHDYTFANMQFKPGTQESSVPHLLNAMASFILFPAAEPDEIFDTQATLTIAQLFMSNAKKNRVTTTNTRKSIKQETPLCLFIPMQVYHETKSMQLVQMLYKLGIGVHPCRLSEVLDDVAFAVSEQFRKENQVLPQRLNKNEFTIGHIDNVDIRTVATHAQQEFHGTAFTVIQPNAHQLQRTQMAPSFFPKALHRDLALPLSYTKVNVSMLNIKNVKLSRPLPPQQRQPHQSDPKLLQSANAVQNLWVQTVEDHVNGKVLGKKSTVTWPSFYAHKSLQENRHMSAAPATKMLLPVLDETFCTLSTIVHALKVLISITNKVNPGQVAVAVFDQPPYGIARSAQMVDPALGRHILHIELGGLHVEMNCQDLQGKLLEGSGWVEVLTKIGIMGPSRLTHSNVM